MSWTDNIFWKRIQLETSGSLEICEEPKKIPKGPYPQLNLPKKDTWIRTRIPFQRDLGYSDKTISFKNGPIWASDTLLWMK